MDRRRQGDYYRVLLEAAGDGVYGIDREGCCTFANGAAAELLGYGPEELVGRPMHQLVHHHRADGTPYPLEECPICAAPRTGRGCRVEGEVLWRRDGGSLAADYVVAPVVEGGAVVGAVVTFREVGARRREEETLREREAEYRALLEQAADGIALADSQGRFVLVNARACAMLGYTAEEAAALTVLDVIPPEDLATNPLRSTDLKVGEALLNERRLRRKDGTTITVEASTTRLADGRLQFIVRDISERRRAEAALRESEARNRALLAAIPDSIFRIRRDGTVLDFQAGGVTGLFAAPEQFVGRALADILPEEVAARGLRQVAEALDTSAVQTYEYQLASPGGARDFEARLVVGGPDEVLAIVRDITEQRRAEGARRLLAEAGTLLAASLDYETTLSSVTRLAVPAFADWCAIDVIGGDGAPRRVAVAHANPAKERVTRALHRSYRPNPDGIVARVLRSGKAELYAEFAAAVRQSAAPDPERRRLLEELDPRSVMAVPLVARGRTVGSIAFAVTESDRRYGPADLALAEDLAGRVAAAIDNARLYRASQEVQAQLAHQAARARALAGASQAFAASQLDLPAVLEVVTHRLVELLGEVCVVRLVSDDGQWLEPVAMHHPNPEALAFARRMMADAPERISEGLNGRVVRTGEALLLPVVDQGAMRAAIKPEYLEYIERFGGSHSVLIAPLRLRGKVIGVLSLARETPGPPYTTADRAFLQDLADRAALAIDNARLYEQARAAVRLRDRFLSIASHELRTPVAGIKGYAQLLQRRLADGPIEPERLARYVEAIAIGSDRMAVLTDDLLDVSRLHTGQFLLRPEPLDLTALVRRVVERFADRLDGRHRLAVEVGVESCPLDADADRLEQVLTNLLENAVKYAPGGGVIRVTLAPDADGVLLAVADPGIGLPPGLAETIFTPFGRAPNAVERQLPGLGLGLYICRDIVQRHGGRIWAESAGEGQGTTFRVWLPCGGVERGA